MNKWLVATGDIDEGFTLYGPFETPEEADKWAATQPFYPLYTLAPLQKAASND